MILEQGNMWDVFGKTTLFLITTNPIVKADGSIVMGRGIAKQMKDKYPAFPYRFANRYRMAVDEQKFVDVLAPTSIGLVGVYGGQMCGWFMVKAHWQLPADLSVIDRSVHELSKLAKASKDYRIDLNFPGIGNGKLKREDVLPIIEQLPDNVHVWEFKE